MTWELDPDAASAEELLELAAMVEQGGFDFYARLSSRSENPRERNELRHLRDEEGLHKGWFLAQLRARGGRPGGSLPPGLQAELESRFLTPVSSLFAAGPVENRDVLRLGTALEREAIDLYRVVREVLDPPQQTELDRIIAEQERHLRALEALRTG